MKNLNNMTVKEICSSGKRKPRARRIAEKYALMRAFDNQDYYEPLTDSKALVIINMFDDDYEVDFTTMTDQQIVNFVSNKCFSEED